MFEYDWSTHMLSGDDNVDSSSSDHHHHHYPYPYPDPTQLGFTNPYSTQPHFHNSNEPTHHHLINPLSIWPYSPIMNHHDPNHDPTRFIMVPKAEPLNDYGSGIGLNLGGRTYFSSAENEFVNRLYRGSTRQQEGSLVNVPRCQVEGCGTELTHAKHYHRRHKVCEFHSKAAAAAVAGLTQRFCQQCSRFHLLMEFDNGKRSCRKRLADHNRRRRKSNNQGANTNQDQHNQLALVHSPSDIARSPQDSGTQSTSSSSMAISSPGISFDYFRQGSY